MNGSRPTIGYQKCCFVKLACSLHLLSLWQWRRMAYSAFQILHARRLRLTYSLTSEADYASRIHIFQPPLAYDHTWVSITLGALCPTDTFPHSCAGACSTGVTKSFPYLQVTYPPPHVGYDHNWALFGLGMDAANKTHIGAVSNECAMLLSALQLHLAWPIAPQLLVSWFRM